MKIPSRQSFCVKQQRRKMRRILRRSLPLLGIRHNRSWVRRYPFWVRQWQVEAWMPSYCHLCTRKNDHSGLSLGGVTGILGGLDINFASTQRWWLKPRLCSWRDKVNKKKANEPNLGEYRHWKNQWSQKPVEAVGDSQLWKCLERAANQTGNDARAESWRRLENGNS